MLLKYDAFKFKTVAKNMIKIQSENNISISR